MTVWPSIAIYPLGRKLGQWFAITWPDIFIFRLGNLFALLSIPLATILYFCRVAPRIGIRYRLTNRRILVERGLTTVMERELALADFDEIAIEVQEGQAWYHAGDLVFKKQGQPVFRLDGVSRPDTFQQICQNSRIAWQGVHDAMQAEVQPA